MPHVDQAAHVGGLLAGVAVGALMAAVPSATGARAALVRHGATALLVTACVGTLLHVAPQRQAGGAADPLGRTPRADALTRAWKNGGMHRPTSAQALT